MTERRLVDALVSPACNSPETFAFPLEFYDQAGGNKLVQHPAHVCSGERIGGKHFHLQTHRGCSVHAAVVREAEQSDEE